MIRQTLLLSLLAFVFCGPASAAVINFEDLNVGDSGLSLVSGGATFTVSNQGRTRGNPRELMIFDGTCGESSPFPGSSSGCSGGDSDLYFPDEGNILIISEDNDSSDPDDSARGGKIKVDFGTAANITSVMTLALDVDETVTVSAVLDNVIQEVIALNGPNGTSALAFFAPATQADMLIFDFHGSAAIGNIDYTVVPVPAALPLLLSALAMVGFSRRS